MMRANFGRSGHSLRQNRVTLPAVSLQHTYESIPDGYHIGLQADIESLGVSAVLCKNGGTALDKWKLAATHSTTVVDNDLAAATAKGEKTISISTALAATVLSKDVMAGGYLWIVGGTGLPSTGAFKKYLLAGNDVGDGTGPIDFHLESPLEEDLDTTTDVIAIQSYFNNTAVGTAGRNKVVGVPMVDVPADHYWWAVYKGDMLVQHSETHAVAGAKTQLMPAAAGKVALRDDGGDVVAEIVGFAKYQNAAANNDYVVVTLDISFLDQQTAN